MKRKNSLTFFILLLSFNLVCYAAETATERETTKNSQRIRDPFSPFIPKESPGQKNPGSALTPPLQHYDLEQLKLVGIVVSENQEKKMAIVQDPRGRSYVVTKGTLIGQRGGTVAKILDDQVIIEERTGKGRLRIETRRIILDLHRAESEERYEKETLLGGRYPMGHHEYGF